ncbi:MAG: phosphodiester glycosidase family protein, partial [Planctomycetes bacterium]|nr:phosphodiester glycosidase family protein [Planctomycetota bacterium]
EADLRTKGFALRCLRARGEETLEALCEHGADPNETILAAINGDYFFRGGTPVGVTWGLTVSRGELLYPPSRKSVLYVDERGRPRIDVLDLKCELAVGADRAARWTAADGVNLYGSTTAERGIWIFTSRFDKETKRGPMTADVVVGEMDSPLRVGETAHGRILSIARGTGGTAIPDGGVVVAFRGASADATRDLQAGAFLQVRVSLPPAKGRVLEAIGGGPRLVRSGRPTVEFSRESFTTKDRLYLEKQRHPRAAIGLDRTGNRVFFVAVEGRAATSVGMSMQELATFLSGLGATDALAMDGGGSVGLIITGYKAALGRSGGGTPEERMLANGLAVVLCKEDEKEGEATSP